VCVCVCMCYNTLSPFLGCPPPSLAASFGHVPLTEPKNLEKRMLHMQPYGIFAYHTKLMLPLCKSCV